ncbi:MAG: RtcB family protein [Fodinibius sp.]|nr:RtcB family protein [Fodinibius sp.]
MGCHAKQARGDLKDKARRQLGTVGSGNHYVDIFNDEENHIWIGIHFGSRGFGYQTAQGFMNLSQGKEWNDKFEQKEVLLDLDTPLGHDYFCGHESGRSLCLRRPRMGLLHPGRCLRYSDYRRGTQQPQFCRGRKSTMVKNYIVVRKGATPAFPGQRGFVGGSMGDISVILEGVDSPESRQALHSTIHGAGRLMSRTKAKGNYRGRDLYAVGHQTKDDLQAAAKNGR